MFVCLVAVIHSSSSHKQELLTMSGPPKRPHEESGHSSSSKYPHPHPHPQPHDDSGPYPKLSSSVSNEYHPPYDIGPDARLPKIPRTDSRDPDRRSPLHSIYRMPSNSSDMHIDHPSAPDNRLESRDTRDARFENRDTKTEARELYNDARRDAQSSKGEKEVRYESRGDDNKEVKYERQNFSDLKADPKMEGYALATSHLNWKESKDYHRGKRHSDAPPAPTDTWHRGSSQGHVEVGKELPTTEERDHVEAHEAVGENKFDSKGDDKFKEKDRKRKDAKHRDWGEKDKERSDRRSSIQVAISSSEGKEPAKEERDAERSERERRDIGKDKERVRERERDHTKRDPWNGVDKDGSNNEKEVGDGSIRMSEQDNLPPEQKKQKDFDSWRTVDRESRDRRKERDVDVEGDRAEKHRRGYDKESDDGCADGEGATDREREVYNHGVQRKRMQRSRGSPLVPNHDLRFRSRIQDNEGWVLIFSFSVSDFIASMMAYQFHIIKRTCENLLYLFIFIIILHA